MPNKYEIHVRRNNLLLDSYRGVFVTVTNTELLKTRLWIVFDSETGLDYGGLQRYVQRVPSDCDLKFSALGSRSGSWFQAHAAVLSQ